MLDKGLVMIHLDPRVEGVVVPERFKSDPVLRLNIAYGYRLPALDIGLEGVYAVLSFSKQNFGCTLPWSSIFALTSPDQSHEGIVWPESVPPELRRALGVEEPEEDGSEPAPPTAGSEAATEPEAAPEAAHEALPPLFVVHEGGLAQVPPSADASDGGGDAPPPDSSPRRRPHLSIVKG